MIKKVIEVKSKEGEDISKHIAKLVEEFKTDEEIMSTASMTPEVGVLSDGKKYALWLGRNVAIFAIRKSKDRLVIGLIKDTRFNNIAAELEKVGIAIQGFTTETEEPIWNQLRSCLTAVLRHEPTDEVEKPEAPEEREEPEEPEKRERAESPEVPLDEADIETLNEGIADMVKAGETLERKGSGSKSRSSTPPNEFEL